MKIAVVQHTLRATPLEDAEALALAARAAADAGAELCVLPEVFSLHEGEARESLLVALDEIPGARLMPHVGPGSALAFVSDPLSGLEGLGRPGLVVGDGCCDADAWRAVLDGRPDFVVMCPRSESELQAEASLELAIALSDSVAGLVIIAECDGGEPGEAGHGGSAIVLLGEIMSEALGGDDVLVADIVLPISPPEPREPLPEVPTLLAQRLASHQGRHLDMGYLADLS